jgi:glycosyltransferase involved in cell wall biosynthesis
MKPTFVLAFTRKNSGVAWHRIYTPLMAMDIEVCFIEQITDIDPEIWNKVTHVIGFRAFPVSPLDNFVKLCKASGVKLIIDQDDWWELPSSHPLSKAYEERMLSEKIIQSMKVADQVWVTNRRLANKVMVYNKNIVIVPNGINPDHWKINREPSDKVRFGYIGGQHHQKDLLATKLDLSEVESYVADVDGYPQILKAKHIIPTMKPSEYHTMYNYIDVSLAPLNASSFAGCKSHLKLIEAAFSGCAIIVSDVPPYSDYVNEKNCIAIGFRNDWMAAVKRLNSNPKLVEDLALSLREDLKAYTIQTINLIRYDALHSDTVL